MSFGEKVRQLREQCGWSQGDLAARSGLGRGHIGRIEKGHYSRPSCETVLHLANAFGIPFQDLLDAAGYGELMKLNALAPGRLDPDIAAFLTVHWPDMDHDERDLVRRLLKGVAQAKDERTKRIDKK